jgi:hypothetical protein
MEVSVWLIIFYITEYRNYFTYKWGRFQGSDTKHAEKQLKCTIFMIFFPFKMIYNARFCCCHNGPTSVTVTLNSFTSNWTYEQVCLYLWKFVSWMFVNQRASVNFFVYSIILHYTHSTLLFSNIPCVTLYCMFESLKRLSLSLSLSLSLHFLLPFQAQMMKKKV